MKHKTNPEEKVPAENTIDGPGSQLRKARERKGLEQSKMAAQLHLSQEMIQALEWDDYEKLPAAVFVQGYLKNYARLLGVDETAVIRAYQDLQPDPDQQPLPRNQPDDVARELHSDHRLIRYTAWGVLLAVGVLIFFWWQGRMNPAEPPATAEETPDMIEPGFSPAAEDALSLAPDQASPAVQDEPDEPAPATLDNRIVPSADFTSQAEPAIGSSPPSSEPEVETAPMVEAPSYPAVSDELPSLETSGPETSPAPAQSAVAGMVVFEFTGPCWVEVRDVNGRTRIIGVMREGTRRSLDTQLGPFRVVIGDIKVARLSVNGEAYNLQQHTRGKVARFTLDPSKL
jgi:cytoskeleton protein RodZ